MSRCTTTRSAPTSCSPEIARAYGIERSANRVLLNVAMLAKAADGSTAPVDGTVTATAHNLNGQLKSLQMRRIQEGPSIYFIGEVGISGDEILVFDIDVDAGDGRRHGTRCSSSASSSPTERSGTKKIGKKSVSTY